jgi:hypothetical protein
MSEGCAIVIAAGISVGGMVITVIVNLLFDCWREKAHSEEKFFYEIYQRRLALYADIHNALDAMGAPKETLLEMSPQEFSTKLISDQHTLLLLINRLYIYGSLAARGGLNRLFVEIRDMLVNGLGVDIAQIFWGEIEGLKISFPVYPEQLAVIVNTFLVSVERSLAEFTECIREETGTEFIDERIKKVLKKSTFKSKKKPKG